MIMIRKVPLQPEGHGKFSISVASKKILESAFKCMGHA